MKSIRCVFGIHTGIFDSHYEYIKHRDSVEYDSIIATYCKTCGRCGNIVGTQDFVWMWSYPEVFSYNYTKEEAIEEAKKFIWNGV